MDILITAAYNSDSLFFEKIVFNLTTGGFISLDGTYEWTLKECKLEMIIRDVFISSIDGINCLSPLPCNEELALLLTGAKLQFYTGRCTESFQISNIIWHCADCYGTGEALQDSYRYYRPMEASGCNCQISIAGVLNHPYVMVNAAHFRLPSGLLLTVDRDATEYAIDENAVDIDFIDPYLWSINGYSIFDEPCYFRSDISQILRDSELELELEDDAQDTNYRISNIFWSSSDSEGTVYGSGHSLDLGELPLICKKG